jgi:hypothetical protein
MATAEEIKSFLECLDHTKDELFTEQGLVSMEVIKANLGEDVTRQDFKRLENDSDEDDSSQYDDSDLENNQEDDFSRSDLEQLGEDLSDLEKQKAEIDKAIKAKQEQLLNAKQEEELSGQLHQADQVRLLAQGMERDYKQGLQKELEAIMEKLK